MSQTLTIPSALSPGFERARKLSRFAGIFFALGFLVMLSVALSAVVFVFFHRTPGGVGFGIGLLNGFGAGYGNLTMRQAFGSSVAIELMTIPTVLVLHHMRKLFFCFARGEVFKAEPIAHIRWAGFWMTSLFFTGIAGAYLLAASGTKQAMLRSTHFPQSFPGIALRFEDAIFIGVPLIIAAYVMEEARRIAADHAEIV